MYTLLIFIIVCFFFFLFSQTFELRLFDCIIADNPIDNYGKYKLSKMKIEQFVILGKNKLFIYKKNKHFR